TTVTEVKKQQFERELSLCLNWISEKAESLPRIQSAISDSEDLSIIDQQVKCLADLCYEINQWQSTVEKVKQLGGDLMVQSSQLEAVRTESQQNVEESLTLLAIRYDSLKAEAAKNLANGKQHFSQKYAAACGKFESRRRCVSEWIESTLSNISDLRYQIEDWRLNAIQHSMSDGEERFHAALEAGTRIPSQLQSTSGVEPHPETIQRQLNELIDQWDVLNSTVNQIAAHPMENVLPRQQESRYLPQSEPPPPVIAIVPTYNRYRRNPHSKWERHCDQNQFDACDFSGLQSRGRWQSETDLRDRSDDRDLDELSESDRGRRDGGRGLHDTRRDNNRESPWRDRSREFSNSQHDLRSWAETDSKDSDRNRNGRFDRERRNHRREYHRRRGHYREQ
uniref:Nesprin-1 n=1 Tax=Macrostomum lignano TaxID=282301 RepID=A0A1I8J0F2_9PLAT